MQTPHLDWVNEDSQSARDVRSEGSGQSAVSMKLIPNSTARRRTRTASARFAGSPQTPSPVIRIAPNPNRITRRSPPIRNSPAFLAGLGSSPVADFWFGISCSLLDILKIDSRTALLIWSNATPSRLRGIQGFSHKSNIYRAVAPAVPTRAVPEQSHLRNDFLRYITALLALFREPRNENLSTPKRLRLRHLGQIHGRAPIDTKASFNTFVQWIRLAFSGLMAAVGRFRNPRSRTLTIASAGSFE